MGLQRIGNWLPFWAFCLLSAITTGVVCQILVSDSVDAQSREDSLQVAEIVLPPGPSVDQPAASNETTPEPIVEPKAAPIAVPPNSDPLPVVENPPPTAGETAVAEVDEPGSGQGTQLPEPGSPAKTTTANSVSRPAVLTGSSSLSGDDAIRLGRELFMHTWKRNDPLAGTGDGLGPVFNARSCAECHSQGAEGGSGSNTHNVKTFEILPRKPGDHLLSGVIHASAIDGSQRDSLQTVKSMYPERVQTTRRMISAVREVDINTPPLWGNGLIDRLTNKDLLQHRHSPSPGPNGRLRSLPDGRYGRFGWKGQFATLREFVAAACANEIGLSNGIARQMVPDQYTPDDSARPDLTDAQIDAMVAYVASLPAPQPVLPSGREEQIMVERGQRLFHTIGCFKCHPRTVGNLQDVYSDFQLHSVVDPKQESSSRYYADGPLVIQPPRHDPSLTEWKTPPLWGVADTAPYWHDGSAKTLTDAILKHAEEAAPSRENFKQLNELQQNSLLSFLATLKAPQVARPEESDEK